MSNSPPWLRRGAAKRERDSAKHQEKARRGGSFKKIDSLTSTTPATFLEASPYRARPSVRHPSSAEEGSFAGKSNVRGHFGLGLKIAQPPIPSPRLHTGNPSTVRIQDRDQQHPHDVHTRQPQAVSLRIKQKHSHHLPETSRIEFSKGLKRVLC